MMNVRYFLHPSLKISNGWKQMLELLVVWCILNLRFRVLKEKVLHFASLFLFYYFYIEVMDRMHYCELWSYPSMERGITLSFRGWESLVVFPHLSFVFYRAELLRLFCFFLSFFLLLFIYLFCFDGVLSGSWAMGRESSPCWNSWYLNPNLP